MPRASLASADFFRVVLDFGFGARHCLSAGYVGIPPEN